MSSKFSSMCGMKFRVPAIDIQGGGKTAAKRRMIPLFPPPRKNPVYIHSSSLQSSIVQNELVRGGQDNSRYPQCSPLATASFNEFASERVRM